MSKEITKLLLSKLIKTKKFSNRDGLPCMRATDFREVSFIISKANIFSSHKNKQPKNIKSIQNLS